MKSHDPLILGIALVVSLAVPATALDGRVRLPDGAVVAGADVVVAGQNGVVRTGHDGRFSWAPAPVPPFEVHVVFAGGAYAAPVLVETLPQAGAVLELTAHRLLSEAVTVRGGTTACTEAPPASAASIVPREVLAQERPANLAQIVRFVPGAGRLEEGQSAVPFLRGLARGRTLLLIDGARVTAERRAGPSATFLDPATLESIEVSRGPGSVAYGSDAFGGIIHARTRPVEDRAAWRGRVDSALGLGEPKAAVGAELSRGFGDGGVLLSGR